jgi:hypothetical protein
MKIKAIYKTPRVGSDIAKDYGIDAQKRAT